MKKIKENIEEVLNNLLNLEDLIGGFSIGSEFIKIEKNLNNILENIDNLKEKEEERIEKILIEVIKKIDNEINKFKKQSNNEIDIQNAIIEKAERNNGFITIFNPFDENEFIKISKIPFLIWCLENHSSCETKERDNVIIANKFLKELYGETYSVSNEKMRNDSKYHNEWIRSIKIEPKNFYSFIEKKENNWLNTITINYKISFIEFIEKGNNPLNFIEEVSNKVSEEIKKEYNILFYKYEEISKKDKISDNIKITTPFNINPKTIFPLYFTPLLEEELNNDMEFLSQYNCIIVKNSDETINDIALELSDNVNSIIFTRNATKTAHLINISKDIKLNVFYLPNDINLKFNSIYKIHKDGNIEEVYIEEDFSLKNIPLKDCYKHNYMSGKVKNLSILKNNGINVPDGWFSRNNCFNIKNKNNNYIARSAGIGESEKKASFSGIFKSNVLSSNQIENMNLIKEVIDSFNSNTAKKYSEKMKVSIPKVGILYQEYIKADKSYVVQLNKGNIYIDCINDSADKIVNGNSITTNYNLQTIVEKNNFKNKNPLNKELLKLINLVSKILKSKNIELEIIQKNNILYIVQAMYKSMNYNINKNILL